MKTFDHIAHWTRPLTTATALMLACAAALAQDGASQEGAKKDAPEEVQLEVTVLSKRQALDRAAEGAKIPVPLIELPQSVAIIDRELLDDQNVVELQDALRNVGGVVPGGYFDGFDFYRIRGFDSSGFTFLDGLLADQTFWTQEELFGMERVEVLKGPTSGLFGQAPAGGLVNLVSKRPQRASFAKLEVSAGSYDYFDLGVDGNVPIRDDMAFRLNAVYRERGSFVDNIPVAKRFFVAPSFSWDIGESTQLTFLTQFIEEDTGVAQPLPAEGTVLSNPNGRIPRSRGIGEPAFDNTADIGRQQLGWELSHRFNDALRFRQVARYSSIDVDFQAIYPDFLDEDLRTLFRYGRKQKVRANAYAADNQLIGEFGQSVRHTAVLGLDWYKFDQKQGFAFLDIDPIDVFDPVYGAPVADFGVAALDRRAQLRRTGVYFQDHVKLTDRFSVLFGGRYDWTDDKEEKVTKFTPRLGATFEFVPGASVFVSYAESFQPQPGYITVSGDTLPPETGEQYEIGLKTQLFADRLTTTLSVYQLTRQDLATFDVTNSTQDDFFYTTTGEQRSRGVELDAIIRVSPTWEIVGNYAYTDAEVTEDNELEPGSRMVNIPRNGFNVWTKYVVPEGSLKGLGFSLGARRYGSQAGDMTYQGLESLGFDLKPYTVADAGISFERGRYRVRFNVSNLTGKRYFPASYSRTFVMPGEPRTYRVGLGYDF